MRLDILLVRSLDSKMGETLLEFFFGRPRAVQNYFYSALKAAKITPRGGTVDSITRTHSAGPGTLD